MHQVTKPPAARDVADLEAYRRALGIEGSFAVRDLACEVCGGQNVSVVCERVEVEPGVSARLPLAVCERCGYLYHTPRFEESFYERYYAQEYRRRLFGSTTPERAFIADQVRRGELLRLSLAAELPRPGKLLDVGCSAGGLMVDFFEHGWSGLGTDPDVNFVAYGRAELHLPLEAVAAEAMELEPAGFDLIYITGSLEHVNDPNRTLALCRAAARENALIVLEARALGQSLRKGYFTHTHRRYLTIATLELLLRKHGFDPIRSTDEPLCGPTRPGSVFVLARAGAARGQAAFDAELRLRGDAEVRRVRALVEALPGR